jgi:hypothetical protein
MKPSRARGVDVERHRELRCALDAVEVQRRVFDGARFPFAFHENRNSPGLHEKDEQRAPHDNDGK